MIQVAQDVQAAQAAPPEWVREELGGATGKGVTIAVLDSGWDRAIPEPRVLPGTGFVDPDDDFALARNDDDNDVLGHGTACADVILQVAPDARVIPVKVFGNKLETSPGTLEAALQWAIDAGVQVINVSLGTRLEGTLHPLYRACERARQSGIIIVAAGHNANDWSYPAIFENVIGVSAARFDNPYHFHYRAEHAMECVGWGVERPVLWVGGERVVRHGTSFAAPGVAGIVALIRERFPEAKLEDVREMLARFALPGGDNVETPTFAQLPAAEQPRKRAARAGKTAEMAAAAKPATKRKRAAAPAEPTPAAADTKPARAPRKSAAGSTKSADTATPPKATRRTATPAKPADAAAPARATRSSRKRTTEAANAADAGAPAKATKAPRKRASAESAPAAGTKSKRASAKAKDAAPAEPPAKRRTRAKT